MTRLDSYLAQYYPEHSRSIWQKIITAGRVRVNSKVELSSKYSLKEDDEVSIQEEMKKIVTLNLPIIFQDENVLVINKPAGILSHAKGGVCEEETVADFVKPHTSYGLETNRPGIIHRLDRATSGVMVTVKNEPTAGLLQQQFENRKAKKVYYAIIKGILKVPEARIDLPIERNPKKPSQFRVGASGKPALTQYQVIDEANGLTLVKLMPESGRTHQLRVHMAYVGAPVLGDRVYGKGHDRMFLHAYSLEITIPTSNRKVFKAELPNEFKKHFPKNQI